MKIRVKTEPASEPFTASYAADYVHPDGTYSDTPITALITAGRRAAEEFCGRSIAQKTYELAFDCYPPDVIKLPYPDLISLTAITLTDMAGATSSVATTGYIVDKFSSTLVRKIGATISNVSLQEANGFLIEYISGYAAVPEDIKQAILLYVKAQYEGIAPTDWMPSFEKLLYPHKVVSI